MMKQVLAGALAAWIGMGATASEAQSLNANVADFNTSALSTCYTGTDLGAVLGMSNPLTLIGSVGFTQTLTNGTTRLRRQPMALPVVVSEATSPDQTTCSLQLEATADGSLQILGLTAQAGRSDVFRIEARLVARQSLGTVVQDGQNVPVWEAADYQARFRNIIDRSGGSDHFLVDNISVYLVTVERYRRSSWGGGGLFANFGGSVSYKRDDTFKGTRILVTGDTVALRAEMFPVRVAEAQPAAPLLPTSGDIDMGAISSEQVQRLREVGSRR